LSKSAELAVKKEINALKLEMEVHPASEGNTMLHIDGPAYAQFQAKDAVQCW
jgi:hypothetical protein